MTREEAKREMLFAKREVMTDSWIDKAYDVAISALEQPEIIYCRECKYFNDYFVECDHENGLMYIFKDDYNYCSYGKRRKKGESE